MPVKSDSIPLADASDAAIVEELFRRHANVFIVWGTTCNDATHERQGDVLTVLGLIEHEKHKMLRPRLDGNG